MITMMPKPQSRPRCPSCYGGGVVEGFECQYCFGQLHDPYYTGEQTEKENEHGSEV